MKKIRKAVRILFAVLLLIVMVSCSSAKTTVVEKDTKISIQENKSYYDLKDVVFYLKNYKY